MKFSNPKQHLEFKVLSNRTFKPLNIDITLYLNKIIEVLDIETIDKILYMYHNSLLSGHAGFERMKNNIKKFYTWPSMINDIKKFVRDCSSCELSKINKHTKNPMVISMPALEPFQKIYLDIVGPINPISIHGNTYILTCNCSLSKFAIAVPMPDATALSTAKALVHHILLKYGICEEIVTDNGTNFISDTMKQVNKLFKIRKILTTPYRPQSNQVERFHRTLANYLKTFIQNEQDRWCEYIDFATFAYNNSQNIATGFSPFELVFGRNSKLPSEITKRSFPIYNYENYASELRHKLKISHDIARDNLIKAKEKNKKYYDQHRYKSNLDLKINDLVLVLKAVKKYKFENPYEGPYRVEKIISPTVIQIKKGNKCMKINSDRVKLAKAITFPQTHRV